MLRPGVKNDRDGRGDKTRTYMSPPQKRSDFYAIIVRGYRITYLLSYYPFVFVYASKK